MSHRLVRFGVSLEKELLAAFDRFIGKKQYPNRSRAITDLIRRQMVEKAWDENRSVFGVITIVYDHHRRMLAERLLHIQHDFPGAVLSSQHLHISHHACLEIIAVKGKGKKIKDLYHRLGAEKGVLHAAFTESVTC